MHTTVTIDPSTLSLPEVYRILLNCVSPRPIALVSTQSANSIPNLAPFSYFMAGGANPPSVVISPTNDRHNRPKHTLNNIRATGEYVINVVNYDMREPMNVTSGEYPEGVSEWEPSGFTPLASEVVRPQRVAESPIAMECRLYQIVPHGEGAQSANYVIGEVVRFHIAERLLEAGAIDPLRVDYIARMSGDWYARANSESMFPMSRPKL